jgi:hypothetical protein
VGRRMLRHMRSHAIAYVALFFALTGTAIALPGHNSVFSDDIKDDQVKAADIRENAVGSSELRTNAVGSPVVRDESLTGADINDAALPTSGAAQDSSVVTLAGGGSNVVTGQITTTGTSRVLINASAELTGANSDERAQCVVRLDGNTISLGYETTFDDIGANNEATVSVVTSANNVVAGTHTMTMNCAVFAGTVVKDDAGINAIGIPVP